MRCKRRLIRYALFFAALFFAIRANASDEWFEEDISTLGSQGKRTVESVLKIIGPKWRPFYKTLFNKNGCDYPPKSLTFINIKNEDELEIWVPDRKGKWRYIRTFPIYHASGVAGPKLRQGDMQVPEGIYNILWLHPNSSWHLSMKVSYPNDFDRAMGRRDGRTNLGGDIFIHGNYYSEGCLAMGDQQIEEIFLLAADTKVQNIKLISMPYDFRKYKKPPADLVTLGNRTPKWLPELYDMIKAEIKPYAK